MTVYFSRMPDTLVDHVVHRIKDVTAGWLLIAMMRNVDRKVNRIEADYSALAQMTGISKRNLPRKLKILEENGLIQIQRRYDSKNKRAKINIYSLAGDAKMALWPDANMAHGNEGEPSAKMAEENLTRKNEIDSTIDPDSIVQESDQEVQREPVQEPVEADGPGPAEFVPPVVRRVFHRDASKFLQLYGVSACERACAVAEERASGSRYGYAVKVLENALETPPPTPSPLTGRGTAPADLDETAEADGAVALEERRHQEWLAKLERGPYAGMYNV